MFKDLTGHDVMYCSSLSARIRGNWAFVSLLKVLTICLKLKTPLWVRVYKNLKITYPHVIFKKKCLLTGEVYRDVVLLIAIEIQPYSSGILDSLTSLTPPLIFILDLVLVQGLFPCAWYEVITVCSFHGTLIATLGILEKDEPKCKDGECLCFLWFSEM